MRESVIEKKLHERVVDAGGTTRKFTSPGRRGVPDRLVMFSGGRLCFAETKAPRKDFAAHQARERRRLEDLGFKVFRVRSVDDIDQLLEEVLD